MRVAALIIGIIGSAAGFVAAVIALFIGGVGVALEAEGASKITSLAFGAIGASIVGLVGGALSIAKPRFAAVLMVLSAVVGAISISAFYALGAALLVIGAQNRTLKPTITNVYPDGTRPNRPLGNPQANWSAG